MPTRILGLDVSTKTGFAVIDKNQADLKLIENGLMKLPKPRDFKDLPYPWNFVHAASAATDQIVDLVIRVNPNVIVVEETNLAKARYTQKLLEFLHYALMNKIGERRTSGIIAAPVFYLSTSEWRHALGLAMDSGDKKNNKALKAVKAMHAAAAAAFVPQTTVSAKGKVTQTKPKSLQAFKKEQGLAGKVDWKDLSVRHVNKRFGTSFVKSDNDKSDAVCLAEAFALGARPCDGTK